MTGLKLSHLDKIYWPEEKITKGQLIEYYQKIAPIILPYISGRPISLNRFPEGITGEHFYHKDSSTLHLPEFIETKMINGVKYIVCNNLETLLYIVNLGSVEINVWLSKISKLEHPDWLLIDLDPEDIDFSYVVKSALKFKELFDLLEIPSFVKTSGATGIHIVVPIGKNYTFEQSKQFAKILANFVNSEIPEFTSIVRQPKNRQGKVYLDFLQNNHGQTLAAPYSIRPVEGAQVSAPLLWSEVAPSLSPKKFTIKNMDKRFHQVGDLWKPLINHKGIDLIKTLKKFKVINF